MLKKTIFVLILIICLFAISAVSATDNATSDILGIQETTDEVVSVCENNSDIESFGGEIDILTANSEGTFTDLANDIANANGELKLTKNYVYDSSKDSKYKNGIVIDKEITINGRGFVINGDNKARAFDVQYGNVILRNMEFINCSSSSSSSGGAVYWNGVNGSLFDCNFVNCYSSGYGSSSGINSGSGFGGAVYWNGVNGNLFNCIFNDCYKSCSYSISSSTDAYSYCYSYGGAVYWNGVNGSLFDCNFINCYSYSKSSSSTNYASGSCYSYSYGGTYWEGKNGRLSDCSFINSTSSYSYNSAHSYYYYSSILTYHAASYSYSYGGAVYWKGDEGNLFDCNFITSTSHSTSGSGSGSTKKGGAIYWQGTDGNIINSSFINCHIPDGGLASAVYWYGNGGGLLNCSFINSTSTFTSNLGYNTIYWEGKDGEFFNSSFDGNYHVYEQYCNKADTSTVCPVILIHTYSLKNDDRIVVFESTQLTNNISVELYNVTDRKILYDKFNISSDDLTTSYTVNNLEESEYQIYFTYDGDKFFSATSQNDLFKIGKNSSLEVSIGDCVAGGNVTINVTLNEDATGKIKLTLSDYIIINDLVDGKTSFYVPYVSEGINNYKIKYGGDDKYNPIYVEDSFDVISKLNSSICLDLNEDYIFDETIALSYNITPNCTGIISIFVDDVFKANISVGEAFELENIDVGEHNVAVIYNGDKYFSTSNDSAIITVLKAIPSINVDYYNMGNALLFEVILNEKATGNIALTINNKSYSKALANGKANITVHDLAQGNYAANMEYDGDSNYYPSGTTVDVVVNKLDTGFYAPDVTVGYGDADGVLVAVLSDVNGNPIAGAEVFVVLGNAEYSLVTGSDGEVSVSTADLATGSYIARITYNGDDSYNPSNAIANVVVNKLDTGFYAPDVTVSYSDSDGELVAVLSDVNGNPIAGAEVFVVLGNVEYSLVTGSDGEVSVSTADLATGSYVADITYGGDDSYNPSSGIANVVVNKLDTGFYAPDVTVGYGDVDGVLVAVLSDVNGNPIAGAEVFVVLGNVEYSLVSGSDGEVSVSTADLAQGSHTASITYNGDENYNPSSANAKVTVKTNVDISAIYNGDARQIVATLTNADNGMVIGGVDVQVNISGVTTAVKTNSKGQITVSTADLAPGLYTAVISYAGNSKYNPATTTIDINTKVNVIISAVYDGDNDELSATLINNATDNPVSDADVQVNLNGKTIAVKTNSKGQITVSTADLTPGQYAAVISYGGNSMYNPASTTLDFSVDKIDTTLTIPDVVAVYNAAGKVVATLKDADGNIVSGVNVKIVVGSLSKTAKTNKNGQVSMDISSLEPGEYKISARSSAANAIYKEAKATAKAFVSEDKIDTTLEVPDVILIGNSTGAVVATLKDSYGNLVSGINIKIVADSLSITAKTDANGQVSLDISDLAPGEYKISARSSSTSKIYNEAKATANAIVSADKIDTTLTIPDVIVIGDSPAVVVATLKDSYGNVVSGVNVKIVVGDLSKTAKTDANGQVSLDISSLTSGEYKVSARSSATSAIYKEAKATANAIISEDKLDTILSIPDVYVIGNSTGIVIATLKDSYGNLVSGVNVKIVVGGLSKTAKTDANGQVSLDISSLAPGEYKISARSSATSAIYKEDSVTAKAIISEGKINTVLTAADVTTTHSSGKKLVTTLKDSYGNAIAGVKVRITVGTLNKVLKTNSKGQAGLDISTLDAGTYTATIKSAATDIYKATKTTANVQVNP